MDEVLDALAGLAGPEVFLCLQLLLLNGRSLISFAVSFSTWSATAVTAARCCYQHCAAYSGAAVLLTRGSGVRLRIFDHAKAYELCQPS